MPVWSRIVTIVPALVSAVGLQTVFAAIFVPQANEMYYDLGGCLGFLSTTFVSLYYPSIRDKYFLRLPGAQGPLPDIRSFAPRQLAVTAALGIWSLRLGSFLIERALKAGGDSRFDKVKHNPVMFTTFWMAQAAWVFLVGLPVYLVNSLPARLHAPLGPRDYTALALYGASLIFEVVADRQKSTWRKAKNARKHDEQFITSGLWALSRHPNYVGEVGIWTGIWALSTRSLQHPAFPALAPAFGLVSPFITYLLLRKVSGVPPLERSGNEKFGSDLKWQEYIQNVPVFFPWWPSYK